MAFFSNKTINYLNLHIALMNLLDQSFFVFSPIYLYERRFSIPSVLLLMALVTFLRMPFRLLTFPVIRRFGLKGAVMMGAVGYSLTFPVLAQVKGLDSWLLLYIVLYAAGNAMHWFAFHTYYALAGEHEKRGRQVAVANALTTGCAALAPLLSAFTIVHNGFTFYFMLSFVLMGGMLLALSFCKNIPVPAVHWREGRKMIFSLGAKIHLVASAATYPMIICWLFVVYLYVGKLMSLGWIIAFGVVIQMAYQFLLGAWVDKGRGVLIVNVAESLGVLVALGRVFLPLSLPTILGLETTMAVASVHHSAAMPTVMYNAGKQAAHPLWFWLFAEMAWDTGAVIGAGGAALLLYSGVELRHVILLALPFMAVLWWRLFYYFAKHAYVKTA